MITVTILKDIETDGCGVFYRRTAQIQYDARRPRAKKIHSLYFQQGNHYGTVGDKAWTLTHDQLLELERTGFVRINRPKARRR